MKDTEVWQNRNPANETVTPSRSLQYLQSANDNGARNHRGNGRNKGQDMIDLKTAGRMYVRKGEIP